MRTFALALLIATPAFASEVDAVHVHAEFLSVPTEWCSADEGVPLVVTMDGLEIVEGPDALPATVTVRRGGQSSMTTDGRNTASFWNNAKIGTTVIGRFSAEFRTCHNLWSIDTASGTWRFEPQDGSGPITDTFEDVSVPNMYLPFFRSVPGPSRAQYAEFGGRRFFVAESPNVTTTQTFAAESDKE